MKHGLLIGAVAALLLVACAQSPAPATPAPAAAATGGGTARVRVSVSGSFTPHTDTASIRAFVPEVAAVDSGGECSVVRTGGSGATVVLASFPSRAASRTSVSITFDSLGHLVRYSERRGEAIRFTGTPTMTDDERSRAMAAWTQAHRATTVSLDYAIDQAVASNSGGGRPTHAVLATVRMVEHLEALGPPAARLSRVRALCGV